MNRVLRAWSLCVLLACLPATGWAVSAVFNGDPVNLSTGLPYEVLPGFPLVLPGHDGVLGTPDDVVDPSIIGDIDLVVRSGSPAAAATIPPPTVQGGRNALPVGIAGSSAGGGTEIPFTVFLSDGAASSGAPSGHLLQAADMDGIPVIVAAFADLDGDGFIGPTNQDAAGASDNNIEVRELEPVGRAAALFSGGVARGSVAIRAGLPASQGGLAIALGAMALTGPFDPNFFGGSIPSGPGIATALPFVPQRDLNRLIRDRAVPVGPSTTLQQVIQFAALPSPSATAPFALPLDGSAQTIDVAIVNSQPAVAVAFREDVQEAAAQRDVSHIVLGTTAPANHTCLRLVAVDRWGNPADPSPTFTLALRATPPLRVARPTRAGKGRAFTLGGGQSIRVNVKLPLRSAEGAAGTLTAERDGVVLAGLTYRVDSRVNRPRADVTVPSQQAPTIQAAIDNVADRNHDGALVINVGPGLYRENVVVNRPVVLQGHDAGRTIVQGDGSTSVVWVTTPSATVQGITAVGGSVGFALDGATGLLVESRAWRNLGSGISVSGADSRVSHASSLDNGGDGLSITAASGANCSEAALLDNRGAGASLSTTQNAQLDNNLIAANAGGGVNLTSVTAATVIDNQCADNLKSGIQLLASQNTQILGNLSAVNDDDGLHVDADTGTGGAATGNAGQRAETGGGGNLISNNVLDSNHGYGLFVRRSPTDDFAAAAGQQAPPGDNASNNNRKGNVFVRTN